VTPVRLHWHSLEATCDARSVRFRAGLRPPVRRGSRAGKLARHLLRLSTGADEADEKKSERRCNGNKTVFRHFNLHFANVRNISPYNEAAAKRQVLELIRHSPDFQKVSGARVVSLAISGNRKLRSPPVKRQQSDFD
jgi:hypothetical protein